MWSCIFALSKKGRNMKHFLTAFIIMGSLLNCNQKGHNVVTTESGLKYEDTVFGSGESCKSGDLVTVHYTGWLATDDAENFEDWSQDTAKLSKKFDSSLDRNTPFSFALGGKQVIPGWDEGVAGMKPGGKRTLMIPAALGYGDRPVGPIPAGSTLKFTVELVSIKEAVKPWVVDPSKLQSTASGLQYFIHQQGTGAKATPGQTVKVHYSGFLTTGEKFDSSVDRGEPIAFPVGTGRVIKGWDEGILMLPVGSKATLVIPPTLGYGDREVGPIPAGSTLIFDVEIIAVQ